MEGLLRQLELFGYAAPFFYAAAAYGFFSWLDENASDEAKAIVLKSLTKDLPGAVERGRATWVVLFSLTFDFAFGTELLSWRRVKRSWAISSVVVVLVTLLWGAIRPEQFKALFTRADSDLKTLFGAVVLSAYLFNLIPDYISAVQTQYFVRLFRERAPTSIKTIGILIADFASKTLIFLFFYCLAMMILFGVLYALVKDIREVWDKPAFTNVYEAVVWFLHYGPSLSVEKIGNPSIGIFYYSTFFPSVWLWILIISLYGFRAVVAFFRATVFLQWFLKKGEEHPLKAIGYVVAIVVFLVAAATRAVFGA